MSLAAAYYGFLASMPHLPAGVVGLLGCFSVSTKGSRFLQDLTFGMDAADLSRGVKAQRIDRRQQSRRLCVIGSQGFHFSQAQGYKLCPSIRASPLLVTFGCHSGVCFAMLCSKMHDQLKAALA